MKILQPSLKLADPHICSDAKYRLNIFNALFDALVSRRADGGYEPAIASAFQVETDARTWTFQIREGVRCHDGSTLTPADVVNSIRRACDPSIGGELGTEGVWASYIGDAEIEVLGGHQVRIVTARPMADLLDLLVAIPIMPTKALADLPHKLIGSGPYLLKEQSPHHLVMVPFKQSGIRQPAIDSPITWNAASSERERIERLLSGDVDLVTDLTPAGARSVAGDHHLYAQASNLCVAFLFNIMQGPCTDVRIRQGINYAVDVDRMIADAADGGATPLNGPLTPLHFGADVALSPFGHDPDQAKALFDEAGFSGKLVVDLPTRLPDEAPRLGEMLTEDLAAIGIDVELRHFEDRVAYAHMVKDKQIDDACCFDSSPLSTYRVLREKINSDVAGPWWQGYANQEVNHLLDQAAAAADTEARRSIYLQAYRQIAAEAPWLFLYRPTRYWGGRHAGLPVKFGMDSLLLLA